MSPIPSDRLRLVVNRIENATRRSNAHAQLLIRLAADAVFNCPGACLPKSVQTGTATARMELTGGG